MKRALNPVVAFAVLLMATIPVAHGEVVAVGDQHFHIRIVMQVPAEPQAAYDQFVAIGDWWDPSHTWFGGEAELSIDPVAGGCFCERDETRSAKHMMVGLANPGQEIRLIGGLGPLSTFALNGTMIVRFQENDGNNFISLEYRVTGMVDGSIANLAAVVDQVLSGQMQRLGNKLDETASESRKAG